MPFQTQNEIRQTLQEAGMRPQHRHGQNFLIDRNLMQKIVDAAEIAPDDIVLEIGPGTGSLTNMLAERAAHVVTIEIDKQIAEVAQRHLAHHDNVTLLVMDALKGKNRLNPQVIETLLDIHRSRPAGQCLLCANLPYNAASPIVADLLLDVPQIKGLCFTVQKEVADRMVAAPRTSDYGPLSVVLQALATVRKVARVPAQAFWPAPDIESAIVRIVPDRQRCGGPDQARHLAAVVHCLFLHRRKTLWQNLRLAYDRQAESFKDNVAVDWRVRPEELAVDDWVRLARQLPPPP
jgi:16S rRNA (adenine1518-N6/adenine1519-N6)-dimethyltransferase